ncbi:alkaline phosphatase D family protein [Nitrosomonas communis]|uniref:alkaline phosphatase D family protein n=1 Tax=Nitrosomonas communis TaxID=44574 RepID=UPI0026ED1B39|nr:alkaline phosphatase D family protein [Nitrosomonas communis]MCO6428580.1 alkaline phosphatase family protein [Nitrosomonas communis]
MVKIAVVSCADAVDDSEQSSWTNVIAHDPDCLVSLGDNIYMDWGKFNKRRLGAPKNWSDKKFAENMYDNYKRQWNVPSYQQAVKAIHQICVIWDDHDFAWNNSYGSDGVGSSQDEFFVWPERRKISRALFEQFRAALAGKVVQYPPYPFSNGFSQVEDLGGIYQTVDLANDIKLILTDGRTYRNPNKKDLLGQQQRSWLQDQLLNLPAVNLIASGSTLRDKDSGWKIFQDWEWLKGLSSDHNILVLSGDIHTLQFNGSGEYGRIFEVVASGIARPPGITRLAGKTTNNYAILRIDLDQITIDLCRKEELIQQSRIDRQRWAEL